MKNITADYDRRLTRDIVNAATMKTGAVQSVPSVGSMDLQSVSDKTVQPPTKKLKPLSDFKLETPCGSDKLTLYTVDVAMNDIKLLLARTMFGGDVDTLDKLMVVLCRMKIVSLIGILPRNEVIFNGKGIPEVCELQPRMLKELQEINNQAWKYHERFASADDVIELKEVEIYSNKIRFELFLDVLSVSGESVTYHGYPDINTSKQTFQSISDLFGVDVSKKQYDELKKEMKSKETIAKQADLAAKYATAAANDVSQTSNDATAMDISVKEASTKVVANSKAAVAAAKAAASIAAKAVAIIVAAGANSTTYLKVKTAGDAANVAFTAASTANDNVVTFAKGTTANSMNAAVAVAAVTSAYANAATASAAVAVAYAKLSVLEKEMELLVECVRTVALISGITLEIKVLSDKCTLSAKDRGQAVGQAFAAKKAKQGYDLLQMKVDQAYIIAGARAQEEKKDAIYNKRQVDSFWKCRENALEGVLEKIVEYQTVVDDINAYVSVLSDTVTTSLIVMKDVDNTVYFVDRAVNEERSVAYALLCLFCSANDILELFEKSHLSLDSLNLITSSAVGARRAGENTNTGDVNPSNQPQGNGGSSSTGNDVNDISGFGAINSTYAAFTAPLCPAAATTERELEEVWDGNVSDLSEDSVDTVCREAFEHDCKVYGRRAGRMTESDWERDRELDEEEERERVWQEKKRAEWESRCLKFKLMKEKKSNNINKRSSKEATEVPSLGRAATQKSRRRSSSRNGDKECDRNGVQMMVEVDENVDRLQIQAVENVTSLGKVDLSYSATTAK